MNLGNLALNAVKGFFVDELVVKAQELVLTAENSKLSGNQKRQLVLRKLRNLPGELGKKVNQLPRFMVNLLLETVVADVIERTRKG